MNFFANDIALYTYVVIVLLVVVKFLLDNVK